MRVVHIRSRVLSALIIASINVGFAQSAKVKLVGNQFILNDEPFYALTMTYVISLMHRGTEATAADPSTYYVSQSKDYGPYGYGCWECDPNNEADCLTRILSDFRTIKAMGFNTVHIAGLEPITTDAADLNNDGDHFDYLFNISATSTTHWWHNSSYVLNSSNLVSGHPMLEMLFSKIDLVADLAEQADLQLMIDGETGHDFRGVDAVGDYAKYLELLAQHIHDNDTPIMAYILEGEPANNNLRIPDTGDNSKLNVCEATTLWYDAVKAHDPDHLVCAGFLGLENITTWDPAIMRMDFFFPHLYINGGYEYEYAGITGSHKNLPAMVDRINAHLYWLQNNSPLPWMLGETGFNTYIPNRYSMPATCTGFLEDYPAVPPDCSNVQWDPALFDGDLNDQLLYYQENLEMTRNTGSLGYAVWQFQDAFNGECNVNWGLLYNGEVNEQNFMSYAKPAIAPFLNYLTNNQAPPVQPLTQPPTNYYDMIHAEQYSSMHFAPGQVTPLTGQVVNENGVPIKDAIVFAKTWKKTVGGFPEDNVHYTFSDENGNYTVVPFDPLHSMELSHQYIRWAYSSSVGSNLISHNDWGYPGMGITTQPIPWPPSVPYPSNFDLTTIDTRLTNTVENLTISGTRDFQAFRSISISPNGNSVIVEPLGHANFKALDEIQVDPGFHAQLGSEVHIWTDQIRTECADLPNELWMVIPEDYVNAALVPKMLALQFHPDKRTDELRSYPNPASDQIFVDLSSTETDSPKTFEIVDPLGKVIGRHSTSKFPFQLDVQNFATGAYTIQLVVDGGPLTSRFIVQH